MSDYSHTVRGFVEAYLAVRKARNRFRFPDDDESEHKWDPLTDEEMDMAHDALGEAMDCLQVIADTEVDRPAWDWRAR